MVGGDQGGQEFYRRGGRMAGITMQSQCKRNSVKTYAGVFVTMTTLRSPMCELDPPKHVCVDALLALLK